MLALPTSLGHTEFSTMFFDARDFCSLYLMHPKDATVHHH